MSAELRQVLVEHQPADEALYAVFKARLEVKVESYGKEKMAKATKRLRGYIQKLGEACEDMKRGKISFR